MLNRIVKGGSNRGPEMQQRPCEGCWAKDGHGPDTSQGARRALRMIPATALTSETACDTRGCGVCEI
jgi:hypothetical protein